MAELPNASHNELCVNCEDRGELVTWENHTSIVCGECGETVRICPAVYDLPNDCDQHSSDTPYGPSGVYAPETDADRRALRAGSMGL